MQTVILARAIFGKNLTNERLLLFRQADPIAVLIAFVADWFSGEDYAEPEPFKLSMRKAMGRSVVHDQLLTKSHCGKIEKTNNTYTHI